MSVSLAPSRCTVYVGNLPFSLTNNDIHKVFGKIGRIVKVTILRDKVSRESKGVAFIQFIDRESAIKACKTVNQKQLFDRKIKCVIANDNGRAAEFIRKKEYPDKSTCYECGESGHLSYNCPKNILGDREPPPKKEKKTKKMKYLEKLESVKNMKSYFDDDDDDGNKDIESNQDNEGEDLRQESLSYAIEQEAKKIQESYESKQNNETSNNNEESSRKRKFKQSSYFSDDEEEVDE